MYVTIKMYCHLEIQGRIKSVAESIEENPLEPTPHFDCHVISTPPDSTASPQSLFESSQVSKAVMLRKKIQEMSRISCDN